MKKNQTTKEFEKKIGKLRIKIDSADKALLKIIADRFKVVKKVAALKKKHAAPARQKNRWDKVLADRTKRGKKLKLDTKFTAEIFHLIHEESIRLQNNLNKKDKK